MRSTQSCHGTADLICWLLLQQLTPGASQLQQRCVPGNNSASFLLCSYMLTLLVWHVQGAAAMGSAAAAAGHDSAAAAAGAQGKGAGLEPPLSCLVYWFPATAQPLVQTTSCLSCHCLNSICVPATLVALLLICRFLLQDHNCITAVQEAAAREAQLLGELQQLRGEVQQLLLGRAAAAPLPAAPSWSSTASSPAAGEGLLLL